MINIREALYGSSEYKEIVQLRREILRVPLGLDFSEEELAKEANDTHFAAFENLELIGCAILTPLGNGIAKLRQMAVLPRKQRQGVGRKLVEYCEKAAREQNILEITLHARVDAALFYEKLGYIIIGEPFIEATIMHVKMMKKKS